MDTDDLSEEAYKAIIFEAEKFDQNLTLQFGLLSTNCKNEEEFLLESIKLIDEIIDLSEEELNDVFFGEDPDKVKLTKTLAKIKSNIEKVKNIPVKERKFVW